MIGEKLFEELLTKVPVATVKQWLVNREAEQVEIESTIKHEFTNDGVQMIIEDLHFNDNSWERILTFKYQDKSETWDNTDAILDCQLKGFTKISLDNYHCLVPHQWFLNNSIPVNKLFERADLFKSKLI